MLLYVLYLLVFTLCRRKDDDANHCSKYYRRSAKNAIWDISYIYMEKCP